jgi:hypothetical protein
LNGLNPFKKDFSTRPDIMAIEIKQLLIKSNVVDDTDEENAEDRDARDSSIKNEVLSECRRMILELLNDKGQR